MVNNFELITPLLKFDDPDLFYFVSIIKRRKDNPGMHKDSSAIKHFYIDNLLKWKDKRAVMIELCKQNDARAYINLNRRSYKDVAGDMLIELACMVVGNTPKNAIGFYDSVCGSTESEPNRTWLIDIDTKMDEGAHLSVVEGIKGFINYHTTHVTKDKPLIMNEIPTKNGVHLIVPPFNLKLFKETFPHIDVQKNNPTLLYCL